MKRGTSFSRRLIIMGKMWSQIHSGKKICGVKMGPKGWVREKRCSKTPLTPPSPAAGPRRAAFLLVSAQFPPFFFHPGIDLSVGRPPSRLPPLHAAGQTGDGAAAPGLPCLPSQSPLRLPGSGCRLLPFLHGFQVKSLGVFFLAGFFPHHVPEGSVPLWPSD